MSDRGPQDLPPLRPGTAAALTGWALLVTLVYLAVRELGMPLLP